MRTTTLFRSSKRIVTGATGQTLDVDISGVFPTTIKHPVGSGYLIWLYIESGQTLDTSNTKLQYDDGTAKYDFSDLTTWGHYTSTGHGTHTIALPFTHLVNHLYLALTAPATSINITGMYKFPALEGYSPESFGAYYVTRSLDTFTVPAGGSYTWSVPQNLDSDETVCLYVSGSVDITVKFFDNTTTTAVTLTAGLYSDFSTSGLSEIGALKYAKEVTFSNSGGSGVTVRLDYPGLSL